MLQWITENIFDWTSWAEWLGLAAAALVLVSFLMKDERTIRIVNIVGASVFVVYGFTIHSASVWVMNLALIAVHIVRLCRCKKSNAIPDVQPNETVNRTADVDVDGVSNHQ